MKVLKSNLYFNPKKEFLSLKEPISTFNENITIESKNKNFFSFRSTNKINIYFFKKEENNSEKVILYLHGNNGNISYFYTTIHNLLKEGYNVYILDYSGYGNSQGIPSVKQVYEDGETFFKYVKQFHNTNNIVLLGESLGAPIATHIANKYKIKKLILISMLPSIKFYMKYNINKPYLKFFSCLASNDFSIVEDISRFKNDLLVIHSKNDKMIPIKPLKDKILSQNGNVVFLDIENGSHSSLRIPRYFIHNFIES